MSATCRAAAFLACAISLTVAAHADDKTDDKEKAAETKKVDLSKRPNEELLKQADAIYARASGDYLAALRSLAGSELQLEDADKLLADLAPPKVLPKKSHSPGEDGAKAAVDAATARVAFAKQKLKLTQTRKTLQEKIVSAIEGVLSAATAFQATLDDLKPFGVEIELRFRDGTMSGERPALLLPEALAKKRTEVVAEQEKFKTKLTESRKAAEAAAKVLDEAEKAVPGAEAEATEATKVYAREQQRKELEKKYTGKNGDVMLAELSQLVRDGNGLKGAYELGYRRFTAQATNADTLRKELAALKQPDVKITQLTRPEDVQQAAKAIEELIGYYTTRTRTIEALQSHLAALAKLGGEFEGDAAVSDDHLFKMEVLAALLAKSGAEDKLPEQAGLKRLAEATERAKQLAAEVRGMTEKAKAELPALAKALTEATAARDDAAQQLAALKQSQEATLAALRFEEQLGKWSTEQVVGEFNSLRKALTANAGALKAQEDAYKQSAAVVAEARTKLDSLKDPLLRAAEDQGQAERQKILAELRKEAGLDRAPKDVAASPADPKKAEEKKPEGKPGTDDKPKQPEVTPTPRDRASTQLAGFQQQLAARARVMDEREEQSRVLAAALEDLEKKAGAFAKTLTDTRQTALQLNAAAVSIKTRVGRGELDSAKIPDGVTEALSVEARAKLDADATAVLNALSQTRQELEALKKPDPQADALKALTRELLALVGRRIDLLGDLKKLDADYRVARKDRPISEQKRLDQTAAERVGRDAGRWDWFLALDNSKEATSLTELMETYYRELVEIEEKEENLKKQKTTIDELVELTAKERAAVVAGLPILEKELTRLEGERAERVVLARARLKPEAAEEQLRAYQTKTGRVLPKPLPLAEKDKAAQVDALADELFQRHVGVEAAKKWDEILTERLATAGLTAEAGVYQDALAELSATSSAAARRVSALTGNALPEPGTFAIGDHAKLPALGGEIGKTRGELTAVRTRGVRVLAIKVGILLVVALLLPRIIMFVLRRLLGNGRNEAGGSSMVLSALGAFIKVAVWVTALALILGTLGFDVTAILAGLGIGGLAIGLAAQPMLSDVIAAVVIFAERRFKIGDVIKLGNDDPARVVGLSWRSTALKNASGLVVSVPNRKVTEAAIQNLTKSGETYDSLSVRVSTTRDVNEVLRVLKAAMSECKNLSPDRGVAVKSFNQKGDTKVVEYRFWWFLRDYEARDNSREEVFAQIGAALGDENLSGTEVTLS
jgi:small-conductance mechanosensitive channel